MKTGMFDNSAPRWSWGPRSSKRWGMDSDYSHRRHIDCQHRWHCSGKSSHGLFQVLIDFSFPSINLKTRNMQVLSNDKYKSATHRVIRTKGRDRYSYAFFYNLQAEKWVEPLPEFSTSIGESPKYTRFLYKDYQALRMRNKTHPPSRSEDVINITHYSVSN